MRKKIIQYLLILHICTSCVKEISLEPHSQDSKLVVNSLFTSGEKMKLHLSTTRGILEESKTTTLSNAFITLEISETNTTIDTLFHKEGYIYESIRDILPQIPYKIIINFPGSEKVIAESHIPAPVPILNATVKRPISFDQYGDPITEYRISFHDPKVSKNYYELFIVSQNEHGAFYKSNYFIHENDPVIIAEGLEGFDNTTFLFSDELFNGEFYELRLTFENSSFGGIPFESDLEPNKTYAILRSLSPEYYHYRKSWVKHRYHQQVKPSLLNPDPIISDFVEFLFKGDVQQMDSNIENGYGVFGGYSSSIVQFETL
ncbi:MAG: DUF4249 domain-containing protein [Bacteroidota bacterium]|nr:DUF4249 domain-containing protein [Bacteroidota bacterium]